MNNKEYLKQLFNSDEPLIIYKVSRGYDVYTDFSEKINLNLDNINSFFKKKIFSKNVKNKYFDGYIGFLGYELLCQIINVRIPKQKSNNFYQGIFYKPKTILKIRNNIQISSSVKNYMNKNFTRSKNKYYFQKNFSINTTLNQYTKLFQKFSKKIKEGKTYQIKICQKYRNTSRINPVDFFWKLMKINSSPESFLIRDHDFSIISCSPETLIDKKKNTIITKPIAGTLKKTKNTSKISAKKFFRLSEKESKEHNMIVDMERNDLSKICNIGSVHIKKLKFVQEYKDLYHYVSEIMGTLKKSINALDIIKAMMPGGSVIGCPKVSTLNLLNYQEKDNRNIYTGSFGFIKSNGDMRFNIIIRSILNYKNVCEVSVASGVILGSTAKREYAENYIKAKSLLDIFNK